MNSTHEFADQAKKALEVADYLLTVTYPVVNDPKLLVSVLHNIYRSQQIIVTFLLSLERVVTDNKLLALEELNEREEILTNQELGVIKKVWGLYTDQQESDVEFSRQQSYVLCKEDYVLRTITASELKQDLSITKQLLKKILR